MEGLWALPVASLAADDSHSAALTMNGFLFSWGANDKGQLGLPKNAEAAAQVCTQHLSLSRTLPRIVWWCALPALKVPLCLCSSSSPVVLEVRSPGVLAGRCRGPTASGREREE